MKKTEIITMVSEYESIEELDAESQDICKKAIEALERAYAPYSQFHVGACVLLENGKTFTGNNQENAAYPSGLCAERVAMFYANSMYPDVAVKAIAVVAKNKKGILNTPAPPCGSCRQVLLETEMRFDKPIKTLLVGSPNVFVIDNVSQLLPLNFKKENLVQ